MFWIHWNFDCYEIRIYLEQANVNWTRKTLLCTVSCYYYSYLIQQRSVYKRSHFSSLGTIVSLLMSFVVPFHLFSNYINLNISVCWVEKFYQIYNHPHSKTHNVRVIPTPTTTITSTPTDTFATLLYTHPPTSITFNIEIQKYISGHIFTDGIIMFICMYVPAYNRNWCRVSLYFVWTSCDH
jgi:hypothetical protein